ncbi:helix-turn-helix domain-containing protein [Jeotgalibacillus sp. ET6]|uniref:helix-turn-helix domain-containing protein n=1 Tax=Jeotgalibacillus sp. ET6 TaxID=3037260 RepID=UPI00241857C9|nr:helix-turn-helix domain-containing protein [Jeotgalibacillus sp. ET6]MDG5473392.1 helix-turn-helix domain-containing protein [Jeotgalibacillus sp. ET6]
MSRIQKLLKTFPSSRQIDDVTEDKYGYYKWYQDRLTNEMIAFPMQTLSQNETELIQLILEPVEPPHSHHSNVWNQYLFGNLSACPLSAGSIFRIVLFSFDGTPDFNEEEHPLEFVFSDDAAIVKRDESNGYVVELQSSNTLSLEEIESAAQALETDLGITVRFFAGSFHLVQDDPKEAILMEFDWHTQAKPFIKRQKVASVQSILPVIVLNRFTEFEWQSQFDLIYTLFDADPELASVIRTLAENLSNVSSTAKRLYLHRNSLQYRLDKFSEGTGLDLKSFHGIFTAYLASVKWESMRTIKKI